MERKISYAGLFLAFIVLTLPVNAQKTNIGIGIILSDVPAVSSKIWLKNKNMNAFDFALGFKTNDYLYFHTTYILKHNYKLINKGEITGDIPFYYGPGIVLKSNTAGIRFAFGLEYIFQEMPLDIFAEIAPVILFMKKTGFELSAGIGVRYYGFNY